MELVLVKSKETNKIFQGRIDIENHEHYFLAIVQDGIIQDLVVHGLSDDETCVAPVTPEIHSEIHDIIMDEYLGEE